MTVAALTQKGGAALDEAQLKALLVGKAVWVRNTVTGEQFKVSYNADGQTHRAACGRACDHAEPVRRRRAERLSGRDRTVHGSPTARS